MTDRLKKVDRALLELMTGIWVFALVCQLTGLFFPIDRIRYAVGLWSGIILALFSSVHMWRSLNKAFTRDEKGAVSIMAGGYILRYLLTGTVLVLLYYTGIGYPLACFLGILGLKAGAYLQPVSHKFYNAVFHETDPVAEPLAETEEVSEDEE
ncbi:MAG: ATP synthase subunit I [Lachnospiraceae bacterium]